MLIYFRALLLFYFFIKFYLVFFSIRFDWVFCSSRLAHTHTPKFVAAHTSAASESCKPNKSLMLCGVPSHVVAPLLRCLVVSLLAGCSATRQLFFVRFDGKPHKPVEWNVVQRSCWMCQRLRAGRLRLELDWAQCGGRGGRWERAWECTRQAFVDHWAVTNQLSICMRLGALRLS